MGEMFQELVDYLEGSDLKGKVTVRFVDVMEDSLDGFDAVVAVLEKGVALPVTAIGGKPRFFGDLSAEKVWLAAQQVSEETK